MLGLLSVDLALAFVLSAAVVVLGLWVLDRLFPRPKDRPPGTTSDEASHKEEAHVEHHQHELR